MRYFLALYTRARVPKLGYMYPKGYIVTFQGYIMRERMFIPNISDVRVID